MIKEKTGKRFYVLTGIIFYMAGTTRLELATSAVTGQRSNQLNYAPALECAKYTTLMKGLSNFIHAFS